MPRKPDRPEMIQRFTERNRLAQSAVVLEIERGVLGCDYGGTSWTTRGEAEIVRRYLELAPGKRLLDIGAGAGWPGLYLARESGCDATLLDLPINGLRVALARAGAEKITGAVWAVAGDGAELPFMTGAFDAVSHSGVVLPGRQNRRVAGVPAGAAAGRENGFHGHIDPAASLEGRL